MNQKVTVGYHEKCNDLMERKERELKEALFEDFGRDLALHLGVTKENMEKFATWLYEKAYAAGHSYGYFEIRGEYIDFVEDVESLLKFVNK